MNKNKSMKKIKWVKKYKFLNIFRGSEKTCLHGIAVGSQIQFRPDWFNGLRFLMVRFFFLMV